MIAALLFRLSYSFNVKNAFDDCTDGITYSLGDTAPEDYSQNNTYYFRFDSKPFICLEGNGVIVAKEAIKVDIKYGYYETDNSGVKSEKFTEADPTKDNVFVIKGDVTHTPIAKIYAGTNTNIAVFKIMPSFKDEASGIEMNSVFTSTESFNYNFKYSKTTSSEKALALTVGCPLNVKTKISSNNEEAKVKVYSLYKEPDMTSPFGNGYTMLTVPASSTSTKAETTFNFKMRLDPENFEDPFTAFMPRLFVAIPYTKGAYTLDEVKQFNSTVSILEPGTPFGETGKDTGIRVVCFINSTIDVDSVGMSDVPVAENYIFTLSRDETQCLRGDYVFASKSDFSAYVANYSADVPDKEFSKPFSITDFVEYPIIQLKCKSDSCKIQAIPVFAPGEDKDDGIKVRSFFTTKSSAEIKAPLKNSEEEMVSFGLTVLGKSARKLEYKADADDDKIEHKTSKTSDEKVHEYMPEISDDDDETTIDTTVTVKISEGKSSSEDDEMLFDDDLLVELPIYGGASTKDEVDSYSKNSDVAKSSGGKLGAGAIVGIVIGVLAFIAIVIFLVWFFVFRNKSGNQDSGSGEKA